MADVRSQILQKFPNATNVKAIKTVQRGSEQHYTTYGKFNYLKNNYNWEGSFEVVTTYYNNNWKTTSITVRKNTSYIFELFFDQTYYTI